MDVAFSKALRTVWKNAEGFTGLWDSSLEGHPQTESDPGIRRQYRDQSPINPRVLEQAPSTPPAYRCPAAVETVDG